MTLVNETQRAEFTGCVGSFAVGAMNLTKKGDVHAKPLHDDTDVDCNWRHRVSASVDEARAQGKNGQGKFIW